MTARWAAVLAAAVLFISFLFLVIRQRGNGGGAVVEVMSVRLGPGLRPVDAVCSPSGAVVFAERVPTYDPAKGVDLTTRAVVLRFDGRGTLIHERDLGNGFAVSASAIDSGTLFAVRIQEPSQRGESGELLRSDDSGRSWRKLAMSPGAVGARFATPLQGFSWSKTAVAHTAKGMFDKRELHLEVSRDGGSSWSRSYGLPKAAHLTICAGANGVVWTVGAGEG